MTTCWKSTFLTLVGLMATTPWAQGQDPTRPEAAKAIVEFQSPAQIFERDDLRLLFQPAVGLAMVESQQKRPFLGLVLAPLPAEIRPHVKLPEGVGLMVAEVVPDSPAAKAGINKHDILHRLGDQLLVNYDQFRTLMSQKKKGDTVALTIISKGESKEAKVTVDEKIRPFDAMGQRPTIRMRMERDPMGPAALFVPHTQSQLQIQDGEHQLHVRGQNGKRHLVIRDRAGKVVFEGPIQTKEQQAKVPEKFQGKLKMLMSASSMKLPAIAKAPRWDNKLLEVMVNKVVSEAKKQQENDGKIDEEALRREVRKQLDVMSQVYVHAMGQVQSSTSVGGDGKRESQSASYSYSDLEHDVSLTIRDGKKHLEAKDKKGKVIYDGPVNTKAELEKVPANIRAKLQRLMGESQKLKHGRSPALAPRFPNGQ